MTVTKVTNLINIPCKNKICEGNSDEEYLKLPSIHKKVLMNHSSELDMYYCIYNLHVCMCHHRQIICHDVNQCRLLLMIMKRCFLYIIM